MVVPALIIGLTHDTRWEARLVGFDDLRFWLAVWLACAGLLLAIRTCQLFATVGKGTPAPGTHHRRWSSRAPIGTSATR